VAAYGGGSVGGGVGSGGMVVVGRKSRRKVLESQAEDTHAQQRIGHQAARGGIFMRIF